MLILLYSIVIYRNVNTAAPDKLTRPLRMRFLDFSVEFMEQQLASQAKELEVRFGY